MVGLNSKDFILFNKGFNKSIIVKSQEVVNIEFFE